MSNTGNVNGNADWSKLNHAPVVDAEHLAIGDKERFEQVRAAALALVQPFAGNDFMRSVILGGLCNQADFLVSSKNERIDQVVGEIRELREMSKNTEIDLTQMDRKLNWMKTLVDQRTECERYQATVYDAYKAVTGKNYVKPRKGDAPSAVKAKRDLNMTTLTVDSVLEAHDAGKLSSAAFSEEAVFETYNVKNPPKVKKTA